MRKNQNGRSMVEMLGVLAIIGVLSVGGVYGYSLAMNKYRANEILQTASLLVIMAQAKDAGSGECLTLSSTGLSTTIAGIEVDMEVDLDVTGDLPSVAIRINNNNAASICTTIWNTVSSVGYQIDTCAKEVQISCSED